MVKGATSARCTVGAAAPGKAAFCGQLGLIALFSVAATPKEVEALHAATAGPHAILELELGGASTRFFQPLPPCPADPAVLGIPAIPAIVAFSSRSGYSSHSSHCAASQNA